LGWREADWEFYLYVEDLPRKCMAGHTVFKRMVELDRRADRHVRVPHSKYQSQYQRRGWPPRSANWRWRKAFAS